MLVYHFIIVERILQDWPLAFTARTILLRSGFYYFLPISYTKTVLNNTSDYLISK